mgnify:CR=1 FL=1
MPDEPPPVTTGTHPDGSIERELRDTVARLARVLECTTDSVFVLDRDWRITYINQRGRDSIAGGRDITGRVLWEVYPEAIGSEFDIAYRRAVETGNPEHFEAFYAPLGSWFEAHAYPEAGKGLVVFFRDVTERRRSEQALRRSEELYRAIARNIPDGGVVAVDPGLRVLIVEGELPPRLGLHAQGMEGRPVTDAWPRHGTPVEERFRRALAGGSDAYETDHDGLIVLSHYVPLLDEARNVLGAMALLVDVTARRRAEAAVRASEEQYRALAENAPEIIARFDRQLRHTYINDYGARVYGIPREQVIGKTRAELGMPAAKVAFWKENLEAVFQTGEARTVGFEFDSPNFGHQYLSAIYVPEFDASRNVVSVLAITRDVTALRKTERALRESERWLRELADSMPQLVWVTQPDGSHIYFNRRWYEKLGVTENESMGERWADLLHPEDRARTLETWHRSLQTGEPYEIEYRFRVATGEYRWFLARAAPARDENGQIARWFGTCTDIEDSKRNEQRARDVQKLESIGLLAGGIAHDFNNLLTGVLGNASLLMEHVAPEHRPRVEDIMSTAERAAFLTRQLLAYAGKGTVVLEDLDVSQAVRDMTGLLQISMPKTVDLRLDLKDRLPSIAMDPGQLQQIVLNLVINAAEAVGEDRSGSVTVSTGVREIAAPFTDELGTEAPPGSYVYIDVSDTGQGMDEATRARMFDPFFSTKFTGRGLGLAAVSGIVRSSKGAITVVTAPGEGCRITVLLPAASGRAGIHPGRSGAERGAVLVVEDDHAVREFVTVALRAVGYDVVASRGGAGALRAWDDSGGRFEAAIIDVSIRGRYGQELLNHISQRRPGLPVLLTSGYSEAEVRRTFSIPAAVPFLQKPFTARGLSEALQALLNAGAGPPP